MWTEETGVYQQRHVSYRHQSKETWQQIGKIFNLPVRKRKTHGARGTHITRDMCFLGGGTHITRDTCFPGGGTYITGDMCFPGGEHISLGIRVSQVGEHISLGIRVSQVEEHILGTLRCNDVTATRMSLKK